MGTATLHLFGFPVMMKVVGNYNAYDMGHIGNPYLDEELIQNMREMGRRTAEAYSMEDHKIEWFGPQGNGTGLPSEPAHREWHNNRGVSDLWY